MKTNKSLIRFLLAAFIVFLTGVLCAPTFYGNYKTPPDKVFMGVTGLYPIEQFYYMSVGPSQALKGHWLFADRYGRLDDNNVLLNPTANIVAWIKQALNIPLPTALNIFRIIASVLLVLSFFYLALQFISSPTVIFIAILFYTFSAGFDGVFKALGVSVIDVLDDSIPEANVFITMSGEYYLPLANALFILCLTFAYKLFYKQQKRILECGLCLLALGVIYIYGLVSAVIILSVGAIYQGYKQQMLWRNIFSLLKLAIFCLPIAGYYLWLIFQFPQTYESGWLKEPSLLSVLFTFGFVFLIVITGLFLKRRHLVYKEQYLLQWVVVTLILVCLPQTLLPIQIQLFIGLGAPLAVLSATSIEMLGNLLFNRLPQLKTQGRYLFLIIMALSLVVLSSFTNLKFYSQQFRDLEQGAFPMYVNTKVFNAMEWSANHISTEKRVVVSRKMAFIFSAITAGRVYCGLASFEEETPEEIIIKQALNYISQNKIEEAKEMFRQTGADYLFFDKTIAGESFEPLRKTLKQTFKECFNNEEVSIFQLK